MLAGGSQAEANSAMARLAADVHNHLSVESGDTVVVTGGHPFSQHGDTNFLKIMQVP